MLNVSCKHFVYDCFYDLSNHVMDSFWKRFTKVGFLSREPFSLTLTTVLEGEFSWAKCSGFGVNTSDPKLEESSQPKRVSGGTARWCACSTEDWGIMCSSKSWLHDRGSIPVSLEAAASERRPRRRSETGLYPFGYSIEKLLNRAWRVRGSWLLCRVASMCWVGVPVKTLSLRR